MNHYHKDYLNYRPTLSMMDDQVFFSVKLTKFNKAGCRSEVSFVLSRAFIHVFKDLNNEKQYTYIDLEGISISQKSSQFILHFANNKQKRFCSMNMRDEVILSLIYVACEVNQIAFGIKICQYNKINLEKITSPSQIGHREETGKSSWHPVVPEFYSYEFYKSKMDKEAKEAEERRRSTKVLFKASSIDEDEITTSDDFELLIRLGFENFGRIYLAQKKSSNTYHVIKVFWKRKMLFLNHIDRSEYDSELNLLQSHSNLPMVVKLEYAFETVENLYYVFEYAKGKDLLTHLMFQHRFEESEVKFYAACITLALGFLHNKHTFCPSLRLRNIFIFENGYVKLTDFRLHKFKHKHLNAIDNFFLSSDQDPPEHAGTVKESRMGDWWFLGVLIYKMLFGKAPFRGSELQTLCPQRKNSIFILHFKDDFHISDDAKDLLHKLLCKDPSERLGYNSDSLEILSHPWFKEIDLFELLENKIPAPDVPKCFDFNMVNLKFL